MSIGRDLNEKIIHALQQYESLIVLCSPTAAQSRWVNEEIRQFKALGRADRIFCVIVDGDPQATEPGKGCFPPALIEGVGETDIEPLAADVRKWADGKQLAKLKLVAGILGIRLDRLRQREQHRRRKLKAVAGLSIVAALTLIVMTVFSQISQQHEREKAEQMATFIVDLGEKLQSVEPSSAMGSVLP